MVKHWKRCYAPMVLGAVLYSTLAVSVCSAAFDDQTSVYFPTATNFAGKVAFGDYNNDGWVDVMAGMYGYQNNGSGTAFTRIPSLWTSYGGLWGDFENDGDLDVLSYDWDKYVWLNNGAGSLSRKSGRFPDYGKLRTVGAAMADFNGDGYLDFYCPGYEMNRANEVGIDMDDRIATYNPSTQKYEDTFIDTSYSSSRGVTAADFDRDGDQDIYVSCYSNYQTRPNRLWLNNGTGGFTDVAEAYGAAGTNDGDDVYGYTVGSCWGDIDNDGNLDLFVGNFSHPPASQDRAQFLRNMGPDGNYHFELMDTLDGADWQESYACPTLGDFDNDGDLDLFFTTVYDKDSGCPNDHARLYRNDGNWQFTDVSESMGLDGIGDEYSGTSDGNGGYTGNYQAAWADIDNDGDLDLLTDGKMFINDASTNGNHWMKVDLEGDGETVNSCAIGSQVRVYLGDEVLTRQVEAGTGEGNQNELTLHFGLGDYDGPVDLEIFWADGTIQFFTDMDTDQLQEFSMDEIPGDANRDGKVDGSDVTILANNWQRGVGGEERSGWNMGDFNGDGKIDGSDVTILANNWQEGISSATAAVPEPATMVLLLTATLSLLWVRRKK